MNEHSLFCRYALLPEGWAENVSIRTNAEGVTVDVEKDSKASGSEQVLGFVLPGMPNLHSHGFQYLMAGLTGPSTAANDHFWSWRKTMYRLAGLLGPEQYEDCLAWVYLNMLRAGYTGCAEFHYLHHAPDGRPYANRAEMSLRVLAAARRVGMPLTLLPVLYCRSGFTSPDCAPEQRRFCHDLDDYLALLEACQSGLSGDNTQALGMAPHSLRAVPDHALKALFRSGLRPMPVHIHIAEQTGEVEQCVEHTGARPVEWLLEQMPVDASWCLVHATHLSNQERSRAVSTGATIGLCPSTEADLGDGMFAMEPWLAMGGRFGLGSDSNTRVSVAEEIRLLEYEARLVSRRRNVLAQGRCSSAETLYGRAASGGARALGQATGSIDPGRRADLVELDMAHPLLDGLNPEQVLDAWVFAGSDDMIRSVWVAARPVIQSGRHLDEAILERRFRAVVREVRQR